MTVLAVVALAAFDVPLTIGPGYQAITWSLSPDRSTELVALLFVLEALATLATVAGGGSGGLFIPLVTQGWLLGRVVEGFVKTGTSLFPVVGGAAYLGAGYRTPIAAVVFVTEASRGPRLHRSGPSRDRRSPSSSWAGGHRWPRINRRGESAPLRVSSRSR